MNKENNINIDLSPLVNYMKDKDIVIEHLTYKLNDYKRICGDYERVFDKIKNYINNDEKELSVDCYYTFKDLSEFDDLKDILEEIE